MDLPPSVVLALALAAFVAGTLDAIAGGGGLITFPALWMAGLPTHLVFGTNKGQSVFGSGVALASFARLGRVRGGRALASFPAGFLGALAGARMLLFVPSSILRPVVLVLLVLVAFLLAARRPGAPSRARIDPEHHVVASALIGFVIGAYDGFFGPGTGTFLILAGVHLLGESLTDATANAKVVNFASNLASVTLFALKGLVVWKVSLPMAVGQLVGGAVGARIAVRGGETVIRRVVLGVVCALVARLAWDLTRG
jgi:uncharacterized membrane protein YfcA